MFFRESHLSGAEVVLCGLPSGWSFWNTASYRKIRAVSGRGLLALLFGIAKTCFPSVRECFPCLMLCVRRCPPEAPLRLSHHSRRNRSFMFSRSVVTFLSCKCSPLTYICSDITLLLNTPSSCPVQMNSLDLFMFSLGVVQFLRTVGVFLCALQDLALFLRFLSLL